MNSTALLSRTLGTKLFSTTQAERAGISRYLLKQMCDDGIVEKLARGVYRLSDQDLSDEDTYRAATLRVGQPSSICLLSALSHYDLTDVIPRKTWVMVPASKRSKYGDLRLLRSRRPRWDVGVEHRDGYSITSIERSIIDALTHRSLVGSQLGIEALRGVLRRKKSTLSKIMETASALENTHRILPYIEMLS